MQLKVPSEQLPMLHTTPLATVIYKDTKITVNVDDVNENRWELVFQPFQAIRITTIDCFYIADDVYLESGRIVEVVKSTWIDSLKKASLEIDCDASFMNKSRHFLVPLQDDFLEIISWGVLSKLK